jgi:hypothetical protein
MIRAHVHRLGLLGGLLLATACTPAPNILPTNDLNRPTDITFMCLGAYGDGTDSGPLEVTGQPMRICHPPAVNGDHQDQPIPKVSNRTFAFVPNSASGDLTVIDADNWKLVDLNKSTAGFGRVPLGSLPEQISSSTDGCRLVSANRGSCDLTLVDPSTLLAPTLAAQYNSPTVTVTEPPGHGLQNVRPLRGDGTFLRAAPYEAVFLPRNIAGPERRRQPVLPDHVLARAGHVPVVRPDRAHRFPDRQDHHLEEGGEDEGARPERCDETDRGHRSRGRRDVTRLSRRVQGR